MYSGLCMLGRIQACRVAWEALPLAAAVLVTSPIFGRGWSSFASAAGGHVTRVSYARRGASLWAAGLYTSPIRGPTGSRASRLKARGWVRGGEHGREPGQFDLPIGVAVCEGGLASVLVVSEQGGKRVQLLSAADGAPLGQLALGGSVVVRMVSAHNGRICVADPGRHRVYVLRLIDWLARWRAIALAWAPLRTWRQRAADRAFSPGGMGYKGAAASFSSMVGRDLRGDLLDAAEST